MPSIMEHFGSDVSLNLKSPTQVLLKHSQRVRSSLTVIAPRRRWPRTKLVSGRWKTFGAHNPSRRSNYNICFTNHYTPKLLLEVYVEAWKYGDMPCTFIGFWYVSHCSIYCHRLIRRRKHLIYIWWRIWVWLMPLLPTPLKIKDMQDVSESTY